MRQLFICFLLPATVAAQGQVQSDSILIDGHYRHFHYQKPASSFIDGSLMFIMHGSGGNGRQMMKATAKLASLAPAENLLPVYPDGYKNYWNECRKYATSLANKENINEEAFFTAMIRYFHEKYDINKSRVVAAGFSGGGHMAYKLGLTMPGKVKAIAAIVANLPDAASMDCIAADKALPVLIINGTEDPVNPWQGGEMFVNNSSFGVVRSSENSFAFWSSMAGYTGEPVKRMLPDTDPADKKRIESYTYSDPQKPTVSLVKVAGGKHDYPNDIDVYVYAWNFFRSSVREISIVHPDETKPLQIAEAACGQCQFGMPGKSCDLAIRVNGKTFFVDGTSIDDHGDAHAKDGFCEAVRKARVQGEIKDGRFLASYFKLLPLSAVK